MKYRLLGNTGLAVSQMSYGAMTFGQGTMIADVTNDTDQAAADALVGTCLDAGVNFFDTANAYRAGESEMMLGKALQGKRQDVVIATKVGFRMSESINDRGGSAHHILRSAEGSLKRLGTDYIDLYFHHVPDAYTPLEETAQALTSLVKSGKVRYVGVSNYPAWMAQRLNDLLGQEGISLAAAQMYYSLVGRDLEVDYVPFMEANKMGLMIWSPLASGFLTGKYTREQPTPEGGRRSGAFQFPPVNVEKGYDVVDVLKEVAAAHDTSVASVSLAWLMSRPFATNIIIGASKMHQLKDNLKAATIELTEEQITQLTEVSSWAVPNTYPGWFQGMAKDAQLEELLK